MGDVCDQFSTPITSLERPSAPKLGPATAACSGLDKFKNSGAVKVVPQVKFTYLTQKKRKQQSANYSETQAFNYQKKKSAFVRCLSFTIQKHGLDV